MLENLIKKFLSDSSLLETKTKEFVELINLKNNNVFYYKRKSTPSLPMSIWDGIEKSKYDYVLNQSERIKELEGKSSPKVSPKPVDKPDLEKPKTIEEYYDLLESKRKLLFSYWQNNKTSQSEKCFDEFEKFYKKMKKDYGQDVNIIALKKNKRLPKTQKHTN